MQNNVTTLSINLKNLIRKYEHKTFIAHWSLYANMHYRNNSVLKAEFKSPFRQLTYLISLYHRTGFGGNERFDEGFRKRKRLMDCSISRIKSFTSYNSTSLISQHHSIFALHCPNL
jgi:hypothetical protein